MTVDGGSTDNHTLNGLLNGTTYNISIFATSIHFNSDSVLFNPVEHVECKYTYMYVYVYIQVIKNEIGCRDGDMPERRG